jgi:hypothetical protein
MDACQGNQDHRSNCVAIWSSRPGGGLARSDALSASRPLRPKAPAVACLLCNSTTLHAAPLCAVVYTPAHHATQSVGRAGPPAGPRVVYLPHHICSWSDFGGRLGDRVPAFRGLIEQLPVSSLQAHQTDPSDGFSIPLLTRRAF